MRHMRWMTIALITSLPVSARAQVTLAWKFQPGETIYVETVQTRKESLEVNGKPLNKKTATTTSVNSITVKETTPRGTVLAIRIEDSKFESEPAGDAGDAKLAAKMKGATFTVTLNAAGKITKLSGYEDFIKKLAGDDEKIEKQARIGFSEEALKKSIEETFASLPGRAVSRGDSWKIESNEPLGAFGGFKVMKTFTYEGKESDGDLVTVSAMRTYTPPSGEGAIVKVTKGKLKAENAKESFVFDAERGRLVRGSSHVVIRGTLTVEYNDDSQTVEILVDQTARIRVSGKKPRGR